MTAGLHISAILLAAGASQSLSDARPMRLHVELDGDATIIQVVGYAEAPTSASYDLQVTSGGNRSNQRGTAELRGGVQTTVATVRLAAGQPVTARLTVSAPASPKYQEEVSW